MGIAKVLNGLPLCKKQDAVAVLMPTSDIEEIEQLLDASNILLNAKRIKDWN